MREIINKIKSSGTKKGKHDIDLSKRRAHSMDEKNGMEPQSRTKRHRGIEQMGKEAIVHANLRSDFSTLFIFRFYLHRVRLLTTTTTTNGEKNKERIQTATLK